jgi:NAD(P)-dependent dehydrogenase (short-subunit alcohol dehydrogenase family)
VSAVLITGALGGIGQALCAEFRAASWRVIATDVVVGKCECDVFLPLDLRVFKADARLRASFATEVRGALAGEPLQALINNAAVQRLGSTADVTMEDWEATMDVNVTAPFLLTQLFLPELESAAGCVLNIASIHAQLTKPEFVAYATSKTALLGMTRALAVDLGPRVRVNAICPAAIGTPMLEAGFAHRPESRRALDACHPVGRIGRPAEVARLALLLASSDLGFLSGSSIDISGAIGARLHDPV